MSYRTLEDDKEHKFPSLSSKKLLDAGFKYKHGVDDIFDGTIQSCQEKGISLNFQGHDFSFFSPKAWLGIGLDDVFDGATQCFKNV